MRAAQIEGADPTSVPGVGRRSTDDYPQGCAVAARLGEVGAPYLYFENTDGGHANAADPSANARRWAMHYTYLTRQLMD